MDGFSYLYLEKLVATAKENYPRIKALTSRINIAKNSLTEQKISWIDPVAFSYIFRSNTAVDIVTAELLRGYQFGVSISPGAYLKKPSTIKSAKENVKVAESELDEYQLQLEAEVKSRYIAYIQSMNSMRLAAKSAVDVESNYKDIKAKYERNEVTFQDYNAASMAYIQAMQSKIQAESTMLTAKIALEELLVKKLEEVK